MKLKNWCDKYTKEEKEGIEASPSLPWCGRQKWSFICLTLRGQTLAAHWIYQNSIFMSWPKTTEHTYVLFMTLDFRKDLHFWSPPKRKKYLYGVHDIAWKWQFHWSKNICWGGDKKERSFLKPWVIRRMLVCPIVLVITWTLNSDRSNLCVRDVNQNKGVCKKKWTLCINTIFFANIWYVDLLFTKSM